MYPDVIKELILNFAKLPGIGEKSAERLVLHLATSENNEYLLNFANNLINLKDKIKLCRICGMLSSDETCSICQAEHRDQTTMMILADAKDVFSLEKMGTYHGLYHILGGLINFSKGIDADELNIDSIFKRLEHIKEVIIATNGTVEGELTAQYLKALLNDNKIIVSRLGYGIPVGVDLKYADEQTLNKAIENRQKY